MARIVRDGATYWRVGRLSMPWFPLRPVLGGASAFYTLLFDLPQSSWAADMLAEGMAKE